LEHYTKHVFICTNKKSPGKKCCANSGGETYFDYLKSRLLELGLHGPGQIRVSKSGCLGRCGEGPCVVIYPDSVWYTYSSTADIDEIIKSHLIEGNRVERLILPR
jgi:(2Fe-2S) ferredoxin